MKSGAPGAPGQDGQHYPAKAAFVKPSGAVFLRGYCGSQPIKTYF